MASGRATRRGIGALSIALAAASPSFSQSAGAQAQPGVAVVWNATLCSGGYRSELYSVHCETGPSATVLDFRSKTQFLCVNEEAVDILWPVSPKTDFGPPIRPSRIAWRPVCWKSALGFAVDPDATVLQPHYSQTPAPNNYMTMNAVVLYDPAKSTITACIVPLFPRFPVEPACADAEIRSATP